MHALHIACEKGHLDIVKELVGVNPDMCFAYDQNGRNPLHIAAIRGHIDIVKELVGVNPDMCFEYDQNGRNPLHIAVIRGHIDIVKELVGVNPDMCFEYDQNGRNPLHIAAIRGHIDIVKELVRVNPDMCFAYDQNGRNPLHIAAIKGQMDVIKSLMEVRPMACRQRTMVGAQTVLHLCVMHNQKEALKRLIHAIDGSDLLNFKDNEGNTILHLAVTTNDLEMIQLLVENKEVNPNVINKEELTAMDVFLQRKEPKDEKMLKILKQAKAKKAHDALRNMDKDDNWLEKQRNALMVVASLIATMAFQVGVNPPGGLWQSNPDGYFLTQKKPAGTSILADEVEETYDIILITNTIGLVSSLSIILLLISGIRCKRLFVTILMVTMWVAISATTLTYIFSQQFLSGFDRTTLHVIRYVLFAWGMVALIPLLVHTFRFIFYSKPVKKLLKLMRNWFVMG